MRRALTIALLAALCLLQLLCLWRAPAVHAPALITVTLKPGQAIALGRTELAAPQAAPIQLGVRRDEAGHWLVRNLGPGRPLLTRLDGQEQRLGSRALDQGRWFQVGASRFEVGRGNALRGAGHDWTYDGATLLRDGEIQPLCPGSARLAALWNRIAPHALTTDRPITFGGNLNCGNRIAIAWLAGASAQAARTPAELLMLSSGAGMDAPVLVSSLQGASELAQLEEPLDGAGALVAGRTRLALHVDGARLELRPQRHVALFTEPKTLLPPGVAWTWQPRADWAIPPGSGWWIAAVLAGAGAAAWLRPGASASALLVLGGVAALLCQRAGISLGVGVSMLLAWGALWRFLLATPRPALATCAGVLLLAAGLLMQLEMGMGAMESSWLRHFQKTSALLAVGLGAATWIRLRGPLLAQERLEYVLAALAGAALLALALQVLLGDETGVFDLQPVEFAKLALTALTAHCIAIGLGLPQQSGAPLRWLHLAGPVLLFGALLGLALVEVDDYSPLILLLVWSMAMALAWSLAARRPAAVAALVGAGCMALGAIAWLRMTGLPDWGFYADRFAVWLDPARHPHTGQQLLLGARAIADGAWWGADNWLGVGALGQAAGSALHIPAVQDDFAPSFFINRHGLLGALGLWALQALFLAGIVQTAARAFAASAATGDFRQAWLWRFRCFVLCGGAAFVFGHLLLSWGTNLAMFPIMGQPMSFLSAGGSHLLFFICPLLAFNALSAQSFEEKPSCRSMSNTKSWAR
ncbi:MAG: FtsW/RodA/SpoVE family cell cycle protein [Pseudomonadota bacterium]